MLFPDPIPTPSQWLFLLCSRTYWPSLSAQAYGQSKKALIELSYQDIWHSLKIPALVHQSILLEDSLYISRTDQILSTGFYLDLILIPFHFPVYFIQSKLNILWNYFLVNARGHDIYVISISHYLDWSLRSLSKESITKFHIGVDRIPPCVLPLPGAIVCVTFGDWQ